MAGTKDDSQVRQEVPELALLFEISQLLGRGNDLRDEVYPILAAIAEHTGMLRGTITLLNRRTGEIFIEVAHGLSAAQQKRGRYLRGEGVIGRVVQEGKPMAIPRISEEPCFLDRTGARKNLRKEDVSFICVPVKARSEVIGTLSVDRLFDDNVSLNEDVRLLTIIASMIARAVQAQQQAEEEQMRLLDENVRLRMELRDRFRPANIIGRSGVMQEVFDLIAQVAQSNATVLIRGESGVGKELVAHAIHYNSARASKPFIRVNCAALPESIIESELFGHERGAFTSAVAQRRGRFEMSHGGSILLDEIGDLSPLTQVHLLRVLQERAFERVGGTETIKVDVRVIAATNRDLEDLVAQKVFREDLYYRLNVFPIYVPPLRERRTDILLLANHFVEKFGKARGSDVWRISNAAIDMLLGYHWPGNVRELENCMERAVLLSADNTIHPHHLPPTIQAAKVSQSAEHETLENKLDGFERNLIIEALKEANGNMAKAAQILGTTERVIGLRVSKFGLRPKDHRKRR